MLMVILMDTNMVMDIIINIHIIMVMDTVMKKIKIHKYLYLI